MADKMSQIEIAAYDYAQVLAGKDSIMHSMKQTSVRLALGNLERVDALAEMGKRSRNQIINDALEFGLQLIIDQFEEEDKKQFIQLLIKHSKKLSSEDESGKKAGVSS